MKEFLEEVWGITIGGQIFNNFRYANVAAFISHNEAELQEIITRLNETCKDYGKEINTKNKDDVYQ